MEKKQNAGWMDMTKGNPFRLLLLFSLPLIAGNALQQLYNMVDSIVVGRFVGQTALAAVGVAFPVIFLMASLFMGFGSGAMVMISQYFGGGEQENLRKTVDTMYTALMVGGIPLCVLGALLTNPILNLLSIPHDARDEAFIYLIIVMGGMLGSLGYNANAGILQGLGDSKTPLLFLALACVLNIVLDLVFVLVVPWGAAGVAVATVAAQWFSWIFGIFYINKKYPEIAIRPLSFRFDKQVFKEILRLGLPASIQQSMFGIGAIAMTRLVNTFGSAFAAGYSAANKLDTFAFLPIQSIAIAVTTYTGQNIGAGLTDRAKKGADAALIMALGFALLGLLIIPAGPWLMRLFTDEPAVIDAGMAFLNRIMPFYWMLATQFILNSVIRGAGVAIVPMISGVLSFWLARIPCAYIFAHFFGADNLNFAYAAGWVISLSITVPYYLSGKWKNRGITRAGSNL